MGILRKVWHWKWPNDLVGFLWKKDSWQFHAKYLVDIDCPWYFGWHSASAFQNWVGQDQQGADGLEECFDMLHEWLSKKEIVALIHAVLELLKMLFLIGESLGIWEIHYLGNLEWICSRKLFVDCHFGIWPCRETDFRKATLIYPSVLEPDVADEFWRI